MKTRINTLPAGVICQRKPEMSSEPDNALSRVPRVAAASQQAGYLASTQRSWESVRVSCVASGVQRAAERPSRARSTAATRASPVEQPCRAGELTYGSGKSGCSRMQQGRDVRTSETKRRTERVVARGAAQSDDSVSHSGSRRPSHKLTVDSLIPQTASQNAMSP